MAYQKGSAAWDIGMILTVHRAIGPIVCEKTAELQRSVGQPALERVRAAWATSCTCHFGDGPEQHTSDLDWRRDGTPHSD